MVRGRDALYGHQRRLQLSRYQRSDFAERFAKLCLHASAALAVSRTARVGDIRPATRAASLLTLDYRCRGGLRPTPTRFRRPAPRDSSRLLAYSLVRTRARRQTRAHPGRMPRGVLCELRVDRKSTRLNSSHVSSSYAVFCLRKKQKLDGAVLSTLWRTTGGVRCALGLGL